jgi:hypothetical protein
VTSPPFPLAPPPAPDPEAARVEAVLERVRAGVRQRQAELATLSGGEEVKLRLLELKTLEYVEEPLAFSPRPMVGPLLVLARKAVFHLFVSWWARPVLQRQNRFNQVASQLLHELVANQARLAEGYGQLARRVEALEPAREGGGREADLEAAPPAAGPGTAA